MLPEKRWNLSLGSMRDEIIIYSYLCIVSYIGTSYAHVLCL